MKQPHPSGRSRHTTNSDGPGSGASIRTTQNSPSSRLWILGPLPDLLLIVGSPLLIFFAITLAQLKYSGEAIATFVVIWAIGHHLPGMMRAYGDRALFRRFRIRFILAPFFLLPITILSYVYAFLGIHLVVAIWGWWHYLMQTYGFVRIYDAKAGCRDGITRWLDKAMCLVWFVAVVLLNDNTLYGFVNGFYNNGVSLPSARFFESLRTVVIVCLIVVTLLFLLNFVRSWATGHRPAFIKIVLMATTFSYFWYSNATIENILISYALFEIFHDIQYLAIVWAFNVNRARNDSHSGRFTRFLFRPRFSLIGLYLVLIVSYGSLDFGSKLISKAELQQILFGIFLSSTLLHYYFDGFIWKLREPSTQEPLGIVKGGPSFGPRFRPPSWLIHSIYWIAFCMILLYLTASQLLNETTPQEDSRNIAVIVPNSAVANYAYAVTLDAQGELDAASLHYAEAIQIRPGFEKAKRNYSRLLIKQGQKLALEGQLEKAMDRYRQSLELQPDNRRAMMMIREAQRRQHE